MRKFLALLVLFASMVYAQSDYFRWHGKEISYEMKKLGEKSYAVDNTNFGMKAISAMKNVYYFFISDLDGDNCPFYPSCSHFFVASVKETDLFQGTLMFADRFTRDLNFFKGEHHYPFYSNGKLYDPAVNYCLKFSKINYIPGGDTLGDYGQSK